MRDVDGDEGDVRFEILRCDRRSDGLVGLELDDQVDSFADQVFGIP